MRDVFLDSTAEAARMIFSDGLRLHCTEQHAFLGYSVLSVGTLSQAAGSAYAELGNTKVMVGV